MKIKEVLMLVVFITVIFISGCDTNKVDEITVFAAASLTESISEIKEKFENSRDSEVRINLNFAGTQTLKTQVQNGERPNIFISANIDYMNQLVDEGFIDEYENFIKNQLVLIKNPKSRFLIEDVNDLWGDGLRIAAGDESVPVGGYFEDILKNAVANGIISKIEKEKIHNNVVTRELSVKDIVAKVLFGEVDVGIVYRTDITKSIEKDIIEIELAMFDYKSVDYSIGIISNSKNDLAKDFYNYILSDDGKEVFKKYKFFVK
ncbi:UNVERIFIED_CONTAM: molybdate transport system substrate-binding protein [Acetivibrio alkalicellulosi]